MPAPLAPLGPLPTDSAMTSPSAGEGPRVPLCCERLLAPMITVLAGAVVTANTRFLPRRAPTVASLLAGLARRSAVHIMELCHHLGATGRAANTEHAWGVLGGHEGGDLPGTGRIADGLLCQVQRYVPL